jgi:hypothetical protein
VFPIRRDLITYLCNGLKSLVKSAARFRIKESLLHFFHISSDLYRLKTRLKTTSRLHSNRLFVRHTKAVTYYTVYHELILLIWNCCNSWLWRWQECSFIDTKQERKASLRPTSFTIPFVNGGYR